MTDNVNRNIQALCYIVEDLGQNPPIYSVEYLEELTELSGKLSEFVAILRNYKERKLP